MTRHSAGSRKSFWFEEPWPRDAPDGSYVFLGRAFLETGKALYPTDWSNDDPKIAFSFRDTVGAARDRVKEVMERFGLAIARGDVGFALRAEKGGEFKPQKEALDPREGAFVRFGTSNWNVDDFTEYFKFAQMADGIFRPEQVPRPDWLYIEKRSFDQFIGTLGMTHPSWSNPIDSDLPDFRDGRHELIEAVEAGAITIPDAEELAAERGYAPLQVLPDQDVMDLADWTIEMVLAWVIWRKPESVLQFYQPYFDAISFPQSPFGSIPSPTLVGLAQKLETGSQLLVPGRETPTILSLEQGVREVVDALRSGEIVADATNLASGQSTDIPSAEWKRLHPASNEVGATVLVNNLNLPVYGDVRFERHRAVDFWKPYGAVDARPISRQSEVPSSTKVSGHPTMADQIRTRGGVAKLTGVERQIWNAIEAGGGEYSLPSRRADYKEVIKVNARGTAPSDSAIDRFFTKFKPKA